ncbi:hypothetical protein EGM51_03945 [Verrucomicrobia bacterium S94]|nr:hypothetical protein EGM51_03945 [Verrucomicrobia bacterium S94]
MQSVQSYIELDESLFISKGSHRETYRHPQDENMCLKVVIPGSLERRRSKNRKWYKRLRSLSKFDETNKELPAYQEIERQGIQMTHIPKFYGMVDTNRGRGMLLELIQNEDGTRARSLRDHLDQAKDINRYEKPLLELGQYLIESALVIRDFSVRDLLVKEFRDGHLKMYVVDGFGGHTMIPLNRIRIFAHAAARRRVRRFFRNIAQRYPGLSALETKL